MCPISLFTRAVADDEYDDEDFQDYWHCKAANGFIGQRHNVPEKSLRFAAGRSVFRQTFKHRRLDVAIDAVRQLLMKSRRFIELPAQLFLSRILAIRRRRRDAGRGFSEQFSQR